MELKEGKARYSPSVKIYRDASGSKVFEEMKNSSLFEKADTNNFGFTGITLWVSFPFIIPQGANTSWYLEIGYPLLDQIDIYISGRGKTSHIRMGDTLPFSERDVRHHNFLLKLPAEPGIGHR